MDCEKDAPYSQRAFAEYPSGQQHVKNGNENFTVVPTMRVRLSLFLPPFYLTKMVKIYVMDIHT